MSQGDLAREMGYSDRSTIAKIESGVNDITQSKISAFADALNTTAAYLMGWTDDPYDYGSDPNDRFSSIPTAQFEELKRLHNDDLEDVWNSWINMQADAPFDATVVISEREIKNPDIQMIARAGEKMTPDQAENLRKYAQYMFPEAFDDDDE